MKNLFCCIIMFTLFITSSDVVGQDFKKLEKNLKSSKTTEAKSSVLLDLGDYFLDKNSDSTKYYLESASKLIKQNQSDSLQFKRDLLIAKIKSNEEKHSEAIKLSKVLQQKSRNNKNKEPYLKAVYVQLYSYAKQEKSQVIIDSILPLIKNIKSYNSKTLGTIYLSVGIQYSLVNNLNEALTFYEKALPIFTKLNYKRGLHDCYKRIGYNFYKTDNYDEALNYANKAEKIANELKDQSLLLSDYGLLGSIYYYKKDYKKAINYFDIILKSKKTNKISINSLAYRYYLDSYLALEEYDKVVEFAKKELQSNHINPYQKYLLNYKILTAYNMDRKWDKSVEYVKKTNNLLETEEIPFFKLIDTLDFYEQTYTAYAGSKDFKNAYEYLNKYKILDAKKLDEINYQTTIENQTKFNLKDKQIEIQNLELQNKEERLKVLETEQHRNILVIILLFFIIVMTLFFYFFRKLKIKKDEIAVLNEKQNTLINSLDESNRTIKKTFSIISHDLRGPFNVLLGYTNYINENFEELNEEELKSYIIKLNNAAQNNFNFTQQLLNWSLKQQNGIVINKQLCNLNEVVEKSISNLLPLANQKNIQVDKYLNLEQKADGYFDKDIIFNVLYNIISNAIKYSKENSLIEIKTYADEQFVYIETKDNGIGMSTEMLQKLNQNNDVNEFTFVKNNNEYQGGFGLTYAKELANLYGGQLVFDAVIEKGTTVLFYFPISSTFKE